MNFTNSCIDEAIFDYADLSNIEFGQTFALLGHSNDVNCVVISKDGKKVVSGSSDNTIKVWNL